MNPPCDHPVESKCPLLWNLLTQDRYADGTTRPLPTIKIDRVSGGYLVALQDHATRSAVGVTIRQLGDLERALERCLADPDTAWRDFDSFKVKEADLKKLLG